MRLKPIAAILAASITIAAGAATAQEVAVKMVDLAKNPDAYVGKRVVIADCLVTTHSAIIGTQCSPQPLDPTALATVDIDTMDAGAKKVGADCNTTDIKNMCLLKVTGVVAKNSRGQALIKNATMELVKRVAAF